MTCICYLVSGCKETYSKGGQLEGFVCFLEVFIAVLYCAFFTRRRYRNNRVSLAIKTEKTGSKISKITDNVTENLFAHIVTINRKQVTKVYSSFKKKTEYQ